MRRISLVILFVCCSLALAAQEGRKTIPVDWKEIKSVADKDPQRIKKLVARLSATQIDTTMTWNERILAFYGQSFLTPTTEMKEGIELDKLMKDGKYEECLAGARELLKKNPVSLKGLYNATSSISRMVVDSIHHYNVTLEDGQVFYNHMFRIFNTIAITGEGTKEKPFYVTAVSDEYLFMRHYLDLWEIDKQYVADSCDVFDLKKTSKYHTRNQIYFEITRVLEIERGLFE